LEVPREAPERPLPMDDFPFRLVQNLDELEEMVGAIQGQSVIAVDLENHFYRTFQGFTCLMQLSTTSSDYVIDTIALRQHMHLLLPVFTDAGIVKILHGANSDIVWLQRDFGIYVVNLFDTGQAARALELSSASLSHLLSRYCDVSEEHKKAFQLADWRVRPLPPIMLRYARQDTHYLIYIYDMMRMELEKKNLLAEVWQASRAISLLLYEKERFDPYLYSRLATKNFWSLSKPQMSVFEALCQWRDTAARREDESTAFVMPTNVMGRIAKRASKCRSIAGLLSVVGRASYVVKNELGVLVKVITAAFDCVHNPPEKLVSAKAAVHHVFCSSSSEENVDASSVAVLVVPEVEPQGHSVQIRQKSAMFSSSSSESSVVAQEVENAPRGEGKQPDFLAPLHAEPAVGSPAAEVPRIAELDANKGEPGESEEKKAEDDFDKDFLAFEGVQPPLKKKKPARIIEKERIIDVDVGESIEGGEPESTLSPGAKLDESNANFNPFNALRPDIKKRKNFRQGNVRPKTGPRSYTYKS